MARGNDGSKQRKKQRELEDRLYKILFEYGTGPVTEWVIDHCSKFQRLAWGVRMAWAATHEDEEDELDPIEDAQMDAEFAAEYGESFAVNLRKGDSDVLRRIAQRFPEEYGAA